jgi:hypothetical protein
MSTNSDFGSVLRGYAIPQLLPLAPDGNGGWEKVKPIGDSGLTSRIGQIAFLWAMSEAFRRRQFWMFGHIHLAPVFTTLNSSIETCWLVEVLRVLDKAKFGVGKRERENLTVPLCHERFQASALPTAEQKAVERSRFDELMATYTGADLEAIRNRAMFHLDYEEHQSAPRPTGDIGQLTSRLVAWLLSVAPLHYKHCNMAWIMETQRNRGRIVARHYRRMLMTYYRAEIGKPTRRKFSPKNIEFFKHWRPFATVPDEKEL